MTINGSSERDYESMWRALYVLIEQRCDDLSDQVENQKGSIKSKILSTKYARYLQALEIQRLMEKIESG